MPRGVRLAAALGGAVKAKRLEINFDDAALDVAGLTAELAMGSLPAGAIVVGYDVDVEDDFVGCATCVVDLGDAGGAEYADDIDLKSVARSSALVAIANSDGNGVAVTALVTATTNNLDQLTEGKATVSVLYLEAAEVKAK